MIELILIFVTFVGIGTYTQYQEDKEKKQTFEEAHADHVVCTKCA